MKVRAICDNNKCYKKGDEFEVHFHNNEAYIICHDEENGTHHGLIDEDYEEITANNIKSALDFEVISNEGHS